MYTFQIKNPCREWRRNIINSQVYNRFQKGLIINYLLGSLFAVGGVGSVLIFYTLQLTKFEIIELIGILVISILSMILIEFISFNKQIKPIKQLFFNKSPSIDDLKSSFIMTAKFPTLAFKRIMGPHLFGLSVPATLLTCILIKNGLLNLPPVYLVYAWLGAILIATMHGLIEFFLTLKIIKPILKEISDKSQKDYNMILTLTSENLVSIKKKIFFSSLFLVIYPITLFSLAAEIQLNHSPQVFHYSYWNWAAVILFVVVSFAAMGSFLLVNDIKQPMDLLVNGFSEVGNQNYTHLDNHYTDEFSNLIEGFNQMVSSIKIREETNEHLLASFFTVLAATLDARDPYTAGHSLRVAEFALKIGKKAGLSDEDLDFLNKSALLHDIGKIGIKDAVLLKEGKLTEEEFEEIKKHPHVGERILNQIQPKEAMAPIIPGVKYHHERIDGKGYPSGLKGNEIPLFGRILAVADAFDAMTSDRPYRKGMSFEKALSILNEGKGIQWDAALTQLFIDSIQDEN